MSAFTTLNWILLQFELGKRAQEIRQLAQSASRFQSRRMKLHVQQRTVRQQRVIQLTLLILPPAALAYPVRASATGRHPPVAPLRQTLPSGVAPTTPQRHMRGNRV